jgi:PhoPQ-activated pathogenicity-related protein
MGVRVKRLGFVEIERSIFHILSFHTLVEGRNIVSRRISSLFVVVSLLVSVGVSYAEPPITTKKRTPLDDYVAAPDYAYEWKLVDTVVAGGTKTAVIRLHSQRWRTEKDVDRPLWEHWLTVTIPDKLTTDRCFLMIGGGSHTSGQPKGPDGIVAAIAAATGGVVAELKNIPNQPLVFHNDGEPRSEDDLIGYSWSQFLETGDPTWLPRLPMVKSVVRAMDCITEFSASEGGGQRRVNKFVVAGGSKRGWTTWLAGAADNRVEAIVPIVIDVANARPSFMNHAQTYGFWAEAIGNYYQHKILQRFDHPRMQRLYDIVDPYSYLERLTMPKYIVNASGDQFFLPNSSKFYYSELLGEKLLRYVPNADHGLKNSDAVQSIAAFFHMINTGKSAPQYDWTFQEDGSIRVNSKNKPIRVELWRANNPNARDFRLQTIGPAFQGTVLTASEGGQYVAPPPPTQPGWTASFVELTFDVGAPFPLKVTTGVNVTPDTYPYKDIDLTSVLYEPEAAAARAQTGK